MTPASLLRQLDALCNADRMRRLVELGRDSRSDVRLAATLATLEQGGFHERLWSLQACHGSLDVERVLRGLSDPSRQLRSRAARLLVLIADDNAIARALGRLARRPLVRAMGRLRKAGRLAPIDALLDDLARRGDHALETLLPYGSDKAVDRHFALAAERGGAIFNARLARIHPRRSLAYLTQRVQAAHRADPELTRLANAILPVVTKRLPDQALAVAEKLARLVPLGSLPLQGLLSRRPAALASVVLRTKGHGIPAGYFNRSAPRLPRETILALADKRLVNLGPSTWYGRRSYGWLERLPPDLRGELFEELHGKRVAGAVDLNLLAVMPAAIRRREAKRCLKLKRLATNPSARLPYASLLDCDDALAAVEKQLAHPDGALRGVALMALAGAVKFQRQRASDFLALVRARKNEQDPVRLAMMQGLANVPPIVWKGEHLDELGGTIRDALDARDLSEGTVSQATWLILRQLPRHADWSARWLTTLIRERGRLTWHSLETTLTDADVRRIGPTLLPVLKAWRKAERDGALLQMALALGKRLSAFDELIELVEALARTTRETPHARYALDLIARHRRDRLADLVPRLLREEKSWIHVAPVQQHLHRSRQDLLTPFLEQKPVAGRFDTGKTPLRLPFDRGFHRWSGQQARTFADSLRSMIEGADANVPIVTVAGCLRQYASIPGVNADLLIRVASDDEKPTLRDQTLSLLGALDDGSGVPTLLEALADDRARVAIYALRKAFLATPAAHVMDLLRQAPTKKVTVAKEVIRLVGEMDSEDAFAFLRELDGRKLHRDARVALLRAIWTHLDRDEAWAMIDRAVESGDPALMFGVVRIPSDRLSDPAKKRLIELLARLLDHPDPSVRLDVLTRCAEQPPADPGRVLLTKILEAVGSELPDLRQAAAGAMVADLSSDDAALVGEAARRLASNRPAISALTSNLSLILASHVQRLAAVGEAVIEALADDPVLASLRLGLAREARKARQFRELLSEQDREGWRPDVLTTAIALIASPGVHWRNRDLQETEGAFASKRSAALRRLGLAALTAWVERAGWDAAKVARLQRYRQDAEPLVAAAAQFTFTEDEGGMDEEGGAA